METRPALGVHRHVSFRPDSRVRNAQHAPSNPAGPQIALAGIVAFRILGPVRFSTRIFPWDPDSQRGAF